MMLYDGRALFLSGRRRPVARRVLQSCAVLLGLALPHIAEARPLSRQDALIVVRAVLMLVPRPDSQAPIAVVHDGSAESRDAAEQSAALLTNLRANVVVSGPMAPTLHQAAALVLMPGLTVDAARNLPPDKLSIAMDEQCLRQDSCILLIRTQGQVSIVLNRQAFDRSRLRLDPSFQVLLKEG